MISFRYHLVSIIAVFLALALGIVVGTTGLNGEILKNLKQEVKSLRADNGNLRTTNADLGKRADNADSAVSAYEPKVLAGSLTNRTVAVLSAPGVPDALRSGVEAGVKAAGGKVISRIMLSNAYLDPQRQQDLREFATKGSGTPPGLQLPVTSDATVLAGALLAYVFGGKGAPTDLTQVLSGLSTLGMLRVEGATPKPAQLTIVLDTGALPVNDPRAKAMPSLVRELARAGMRTVVAGDAPAATEQGLIAVVRADSALARTVSTVDNADTALGQVSTVLALASATPAQYGTGSGVDRLFPPLVK